MGQNRVGEEICEVEYEGDCRDEFSVDGVIIEGEGSATASSKSIERLGCD